MPSQECLTISIPGIGINGAHGPNQSVTYHFGPSGAMWYSNSLGANFSGSIPLFKFGSLSLPAALPATRSNNASAIWWSFSYNSGGNAASVSYVLKQVVNGSYVSTGLKASIAYSFGASAANTVKLVFVNPTSNALKCTASRISYGSAGYDVKDSLPLNPTLDCGALTSSVTYSGLPASGVIDPATVGTSTTSNALGNDYETKLCKGTTYYVLAYNDGVHDGYATSTDGVTWGSFNDFGTSGSVASGSVFSIDCSGNNFVYAIAGGPKFYYRAGTIGSTITWSFAEQNQAYQNTNNYEYFTSVRYDTSGNFWVAVDTQDASSNVYAEVWKCTTAPSCSLSVDPYFAGTPRTVSQMVQLTSGKMAVVYQHGAGTALSAMFWSGSAWGTVATTTGTTYQLPSGSCTNLGDTVECGTYAGSSTDYYVHLASGGSWAETQLAFSTCGNNSAAMTGDQSSILTMFCFNGANVTYESSSNSGSSWGTENSASSGETAVAYGVVSYAFPAANTAIASWVSGSASPYNVRFASIAVTFTVTQPIAITTANSGTAGTFTLSGCSVSPTTVSSDGATHNLVATPSCVITITKPTDGASSRYRFSGGGGSFTLTTCSSGTCSTASVTVYYELSQSVWYSLTCASGATCGAPTLSYIQAGSSAQSTLGTSSQTVWIDYGTVASVPTSITDSLGNAYSPSLSSWLVNTSNAVNTPITYWRGL